MSKKTMLLPLAVAALFAVPPAASAEEIHFTNVTTFTGSGPAGSLTAANEPKISFTKLAVSGKFDTGSSTTGSINLTITGATAEFLGIKGPCNTTGHEAGTITASGAFHLITFVNSKGERKPAILVTPVTTTILCIGFSRVEITGTGIIGTITSPKCPESSKTLGLSFEATGSTQNHMVYTSNTFDLSSDTEDSAGKTTGVFGTAGLTGSATIESATTGTLDCT
jgi:hypothetical protein